MKLLEQELCKIVYEEIARGIPEFMIRQASDDCVDRVRQHVKKFVQTRAENPTHARELMAAANEALDQLDDDIYRLIEDKLWSFLQQT